MSNRQLTVRGLIIGALGSIVLTMSSMFIAFEAKFSSMAHNVCCPRIHVYIEALRKY